MEDRTRRPAVRAGIGTALLALAAMLGIIIRVVAGDGPLGIDEGWRGVVAGLPEALRAASFALDTIGGGTLAHFWIPLGLVVTLLLLRRTGGALLYAASALASTGLVQLGKAVFARERPDDIVIDIASFAYPSGHAAFAATIAAALWVIAPRWWVAALGVLWTGAMALSRTHLSAHWLTDTVGGVLVGVGAVLVLAALLGLVDGRRGAAAQASPRERT